MASYSLDEKQIKYIALDTLGFNTSQKVVCDIENDLVLINYNYPDFSDNHNYYQIYDLINSTSSIPVNYPFRSKGFLSPKGDFFILQKALWDTTKPTAENITGDISIYQTSPIKLITNLNLLPDGTLFKFKSFQKTFIIMLIQLKMSMLLMLIL